MVDRVRAGVCVKAFFILSGFYMALVLDTGYRDTQSDPHAAGAGLGLVDGESGSRSACDVGHRNGRSPSRRSNAREIWCARAAGGRGGAQSGDCWCVNRVDDCDVDIHRPGIEA
jgi:hypothetical protein